MECDEAAAAAAADPAPEPAPLAAAARGFAAADEEGAFIDADAAAAEEEDFRVPLASGEIGSVGCGAHAAVCSEECTTVTGVQSASIDRSTGGRFLR